MRVRKTRRGKAKFFAKCCVFIECRASLFQIRLRMMEKSWREHARHAWEVSPALAVFLPERLNSAAVLETEVI